MRTEDQTAAAGEAARRDREAALAEEIAGFGHWRLDVVSRKTSWSRGMFRIYGLEFAAEPPLATALTMLDPQDRAQASLDAARAMATGEGYSARTRITRPDGSLCITDGRTVCEFDGDGKVIALFGTRVDVTDQVLAETALAESEARYRQLADNVTDIGLRSDLTAPGRPITYVSAAVRRLGWEPEDLIGRPQMDFVHPDDRPRLGLTAAALMRGDGLPSLPEREFRLLRKDGGHVWVESNPALIHDETGRPVATINALRDITDRKAAEAVMAQARAAAEEHARRADAAEALAGLGHWRLDVAGGEVIWSEQMYRIYGLPAGEPLRLDLLMAMTHPDDAADASARLSHTIATGEPGEALITRIHRADGQLRYISGKFAAQRGADGAVVTVTGAVLDVTERTLTDAALAASEARFRQLAETASDVTVCIDLTDTITYVSPSVRRYGWEPEEVVGLARNAFVHQDHAPALDQAYAGMRENGELTAPELRQFRVIARDGREVWMEGSPSIQRDGHGGVTGVITVLRDITERKVADAERMAAEAALAVSEARYRLVTEASHDLVLKHDANGLIAYASSSARHFGYTPEDLVGRLCSEFVHPEDLDRLNAFTLEVMRGRGDPKAVCHYRLMAADGSAVWIEGNPSVVRDENGRFRAIINCLRDVTERKALEADLAASEARLRGVMDAAPDIIAETDLSGGILYLSPAFKAVTGIKPKSVLGKRSYGMMPKREARELEELCLEIALSGGRAPTRSLQYRSRHADGRVIWLESRPAPKFDHVSGQVVGFIDIIRDVTERKAMEDALESARAEAEAAAAVKAEFLANMSHELRTPLTAVLGFTRLALEQPELSEATSAHIRKASNAGAALLTTVNDILDFSKLEAGQVEIRPQAEDAGKICREALELFEAAAADKGLALCLEIDPAMPPALMFDADRVRQLVLNLVSNAVKFSDTGAVTLAAAWRDGQLAVSVADNGPGLSGEQQDRLFQRFSQVDGSSTRRHGGTGLGLAICRGLAEAMGGRIGVESSPGAGARFHFEFPAPPSNLQAPEAAGAAAPALPRGLRVLVADDRAPNRELVRAILGAAGAVVSEACDGQEAVTAASEAPYDVILMDLTMPVLDGMAAMRAIRTGGGLNANAPILAFSASVDADPRAGAARLAAGFDGDVAKPISVTDLITAVARQLWLEDEPLAAPDPAEAMGARS